jgi:hypothetical protein
MLDVLVATAVFALVVPLSAMQDVLVATAVFAVVVALLLLAAVLVTVAPIYVALEMADARRFSSPRWGIVAAIGVVAGVGYAYVLHQGAGLPKLVPLLALPLAWVGPGILWLLDKGHARIGGYAGEHG